MSDYKTPRPLPSASASDPCVVYDNSVSFDKLINESEVVTTYKGVKLQSVPSLLDQIEAEANAAVISLGWTPVGEFATGFTYAKLNDVGRDSLGSWWRYNGSDLPKVITAGTVPSSPNFSKISFENAANVEWKSGKSVEYVLDDYRGVKDELYSQAGIVDNGTQNQLGHSQFVDAINIMAASTSLNVPTNAVILSTNITSDINGFKYLHDSYYHKTWGIPSSIGTGETIVSVSAAGLLTTSLGIYQLIDSIELNNYNVLNPDLSVIDAEISQIAKTKQLVITGDSLSFNGFGYPYNWVVDGGGYATAQPFGLSSWAHMVRDMWVTCGFFQPIKNSRYYTDSDTYLPATFGYQNIAINQRALTFNFSAGETLTIENQYTGNAALLISSRAAGNDVTFNVNGIQSSTISETGHHNGYGFKTIPFTGDKVVIDTVVNPSGGDVNITVYGIVPSEIKIPAITGKGAYSATQILAEYQTLVAPYSPDIIFYIIGANDGQYGNPLSSGYIASVKAFIDLARTTKPDCIVVLISMPATSSYSDSFILDYVKAGRDIAIEKGCSHIDLFTATRYIDPAYWRFDNIHCNTKGDTLWFNIFKNLLFPNASIDVEKFMPVREAILGATINSTKRDGESHRFLVQMTATTPTFIELNPSIALSVKAEYTSINTQQCCLIKAPKGFKVSSIENLVVGASQSLIARSFQTTPNPNELTCRITGISDNSTANPDGSGVYVIVTIVKDTTTT